ncbi:MAG: response regulator, partial [Melioribacter sp.]|nr:response regulator [Melioribacter sp.]
MKKILIIEDNYDLAQNTLLFLKEYGYDVLSCPNGKEGLKVMLNYQPDLILCDIMLPDINGYKILSEIKKLENPIPPIVIYITAKTQRDDIRKGMTLGADDYITKPFTFDELLR